MTMRADSLGEIGLRLFFRRLLQAAVLSPLFAAGFLAALVAASALPDAPIEASLNRSIEEFQTERPYGFTGRKVDAGTECLGMSFALASSEETAFRRAVRARTLFDCAALRDHLAEPGSADDRSFNYARYWHGYAAISRPILSIADYHDLRALIFNALLLLVFALAFRLRRNYGTVFAFAVLFPFFIINSAGFFTLATKAPGWMVAFGAALYFASARRPYERDPLIAFFTVGALTAYFDWLTTPLLIFGLPAYIYFFELYRRGLATGPRGTIIRLGQIGAFWLMGYAGLWAIKIALAAIVIGEAAVEDALEAALFRLRGDYPSVSPWPGAATLENFEVFKTAWGALAAILFVIIPLANARRRLAAASFFRRAPVFGVLAASPFVWFEILSNHSQIHGLYTHAILTLFMIPMSLVLFGQTERIFSPDYSAGSPARRTPSSSTS